MKPRPATSKPLIPFVFIKDVDGGQLENVRFEANGEQCAAVQVGWTSAAVSPRLAARPLRRSQSSINPGASLTFKLICWDSWIHADKTHGFTRFHWPINIPVAGNVLYISLRLFDKSISDESLAFPPVCPHWSWVTDLAADERKKKKERGGVSFFPLSPSCLSKLYTKKKKKSWHMLTNADKKPNQALVSTVI